MPGSAITLSHAEPVTHRPQAPVLPADLADARRAALVPWQELIMVANHLLRIPRHGGFLDGIECLHGDLLRTLEASADGTLLSLLLPTSLAQQPYSATHAVTRAVIATLAARSVVGWSSHDHRIIGLAALTMNVSMTSLQDELAGQRHAPDPAQRTVMEGHARASARLLAEAGVTDPVWLEAVIHHHDATCGSLGARSKGLQIARLLQRTDLFVSQLRPQQAGRPPASAAQAAQMAYVGEDGLPDEAGMHLVRTLGVFPPGSVLRLASGETAVVVRRGMMANLPVVALVADAQGQPCTPVLKAALRPGSSTDEQAAGQTGVAEALAPHQITPTIMQAIASEALLALAAPRPASPFGRD